ncbi:MAG: DUF2442 domain-containing protein [Bryobacteraceae bacterium]
MAPRIRSAEHLGGHRLEVTFTDGTKAVLDFRERIIGRGGVLRPLEDEAFFGQVSVDEEGGTVVWPNGADFCPDVLYETVAGLKSRAG